jgi:hypothetical protein
LYAPMSQALREAGRRKDHLLAAALERIPAIEPPEKPGGPETDEGTFHTSRERPEESYEPLGGR